MKKLVAITGMDGVGKNSVIAELLTHFPQSASAEIWQPMHGKSSPFSSKQGVDDYLCSLRPESRTMFLAHALLESTQTALESAAEIIFLNAYYFKYFASEMALGAAPEFIESLISLFPQPDLCIRLTCPITATSQRKERFSRYECGLAANPAQDAFLAHQENCDAQWNYFGSRISAEIANAASIRPCVEQIIPLIR